MYRLIFVSVSAFWMFVCGKTATSGCSAQIVHRDEARVQSDGELYKRQMLFINFFLKRKFDEHKHFCLFVFSFLFFFLI